MPSVTYSGYVPPKHLEIALRLMTPAAKSSSRLYDSQNSSARTLAKILKLDPIEATRACGLAFTILTHTTNRNSSDA